MFNPEVVRCGAKWRFALQPHSVSARPNFRILDNYYAKRPLALQGDTQKARPKQLQDLIAAHCLSRASMPIHKGRLQKSGDSFRLHSFLIQPTTSLRCLNLRMAMAPGVSDWNWSGT